MANLDKYLLEFEKNATEKGITVHFAKDALEHNEIVHKILSSQNVKKLVKSKSMLTAEIKTEKGTMKVVFFEQDAPNTVKNFVDLSSKGTMMG